MLHLFLYFVLLRRPQSIGLIESSILYLIIGGGSLFNAKLLWGGLALSYGLFFYYAWQIKASLKVQTLIENCAFETLGLALVAASFHINFKFLEIVLYHFLFWTLYPMVKIYRLGVRAMAGYLGMTALFTGLFLLLSPIGGTVYGFSLGFYQEQFRIWSYIHITASFMLSNANPGWAVALFRPVAEPGSMAQPGMAESAHADWQSRKIASGSRR